MNKLAIDEAEICYRDLGSGTPVIFLHAFPLNQTMWDQQVEALAPDYRVITFDWRGFGKSSLGPGIAGLDTWADDLAALMKALNTGRAAICGLSMGGYVAFSFYRKYPDLVSALILVDTRATTDTEAAKRGRAEMATLVRSQGTSSIKETMTQRLLGETTKRNHPDVVERIGAIIESGQPEGIAQALSAMASRADSNGILSEIDCPTLIIYGNEDKLILPSEVEQMSQQVPGASLEIIHNAGHLPNLEQPEAFNLVLFNFLNNLSSEVGINQRS